MIFRKNFPAGSMNFLNISHGENTEVQKGHRAAPDFLILAAWRHQGKVAAKIESYQKMKRYRENQEAAGNQATAEKPGGFGKAKGGGGPYWAPPAFTEREMRYFKEPCRRRALLPRGYAAKRLCRQGAVPPRGCAAKGFYRLSGALRKGGNQDRGVLPATRTAPARAATVIRLSHRPMAAPSAVLGLSVPLLPVLPPLLALGSAAPQTVHLPFL